MIPGPPYVTPFEIPIGIPAACKDPFLESYRDPKTFNKNPFGTPEDPERMPINPIGIP